ncbi:MAG: hypothetical protein RIQ35_1052, partial [Pseudomonadota bacterium]
MSTATRNQVAINNALELRTAREKAYAEFQAHQGVDKLSKQLSNMSDVLLMKLWTQCQLHDDAALLAVGGYGRSELFPYSDVDILILLPDHESKTLSARVEQFIAQCWDAGVEIGSSVRNSAECLSEAAQDITVRTSLLEARFLGGNRALFTQFSKAYWNAMDPKAFFQAKLLELKQRHQKYQDTPYS